MNQSGRHQQKVEGGFFMSAIGDLNLFLII